MNETPEGVDSGGTSGQDHSEDRRSLWVPRTEEPTPWPAWAEKLLARLGSTLLGLATGMAVALVLGILLVHRFAIGACFVLGILCATLYSLAFGTGPLKFERAAFRPLWFACAAVGFLALDAGVIWLIMQVAWR